MAGTQGIGASQDSLLFYLARNQSALSNIAKQLATGLRINSPADDPSGYAQSTTIQNKVAAIDTAANALQIGTSYLQVASDGLQTVSTILQRLRALAVEANSSILSLQDIANLQTEFSQLQQQINAVSDTAAFNGKKIFSQLFDSSDTSIADPGFETPIESGNVVDPAGAAWTFIGASGIVGAGGSYLGGNHAPEGNQVAFLQGGGGSISQTFNNSGGDAESEIAFYALRPNGTSGNESVDVSLNGQDIGTYSVAVSGTATYIITQQAKLTSGNNTLKFRAVNAGGNNTILIDAVSLISSGLLNTTSIQTGADEGDTVQVPALSVNSNFLGISGLSLNTGSINDPLSGPELAITTIDSALSSVSAQQTTVGSYLNIFSDEFDNDSLTSVNLKSAESSIRDLNIAKAVSNKTRIQLLSQLGTTLLANHINTARANAENIIHLLSGN